MAIKSVKIETLPQRIALLAAILLCLLGIVFFMKWCFGNSIAAHTANEEVAELALSLAPDDPQTHYTSAALLEGTFAPDDLPKALAEYEKAAALAPNDFRTWLALGKARERNGDASGAESAVRKSLELAPNYALVMWTLGNILLREGKTPEAFAELRKAAESDINYTNPAVSIAWQIFDGDLEKIRQALGDSPQIDSALVTYLAKEKRSDEAVGIWNLLPAEKRKTDFREIGNALFNQLTEARKYRTALRVLSQTGDATAENFAVGKIFNGGFEDDVKAVGASAFEWKIDDGIQPQIGVDNTQKHGGVRSLVVVFNSPVGRDFRAVSQMVAVEPGKKYGFEVFYKSDLKTSATLYWEIADVTDGKVLAATPAIAANSDWTSLKTEFTVPEKTEAVSVRLARENCKSSLCPTFGRVWFDDLSIIQ